MSSAVAEARRLGQYTLDKKLGEGGMGEVYRASHAMLRRPTAIKLLHRDRTGPEDLARFEREVQITSCLTHPNTIAIYDYGRTPEGVFYYAMEYLPGIDLARLVEIDGHQPAARVIHILTQVCGSLDEAHGAGLIHRDVKPENVILCERGGRHDVAKVLDFGIVKDIGSGGAQLTATGTFTGTPLYLSPETVRSPETVNARSDIYALGAVGYFLLVGQPPFDGESVVDICHKHVHETPVPPSQRVEGGIDTDLEHVILSCLAKDPGLRPTTAGHLADLFQKCAAAGKWSEDDARAWWAEHAEVARPADDDTPTLQVAKPNKTVVRGSGKSTAPGQATIVE
jgi:serine/threonine protein kinase